MVWLFMLVLILTPAVGFGDPKGEENDLEALVAFKKTITLDQWNCTGNWNSSSISLVDICTYNSSRIACDPSNSRVISIELGGCNMLGQLVPELGNLRMLCNMNLSSNALTGTIPPEFGNLVDLEKLDLHDNFLKGPIPSELGNLTSLNYLQLQSNNLNGTVPFDLVTRFERIQFVNLTDNDHLTGNCTQHACTYGVELERPTGSSCRSNTHTSSV